MVHDHSYWEERLQGYLDKELSPADHTVVKAHIDACPDCTAHLEYFACLKKRLNCHTNSIDIPVAVQQRISKIFEKRHPLRRRWYPMIGVAALAAALLIAFLLWPMPAPFRFYEGTLRGELVCHDCIVAARTDLKKGSLCEGGHRLGLLTSKGQLWRVAADQVGYALIQDMSNYGKEVEIQGEVLPAAHLIRIEQMDLVVSQRASMPLF